MYLIITEEQANTVRGEYVNHYSLQPIKCGSIFWLPASVIDAPEYASIKQILETLERVEELPNEEEQTN